ASRRLSLEYLRPSTAAIFIPGPTDALAAGDPGTTSAIVPSSPTTMPSEYLKFDSREAAASAVSMLVGVSRYESFQPLFSIPWIGARGLSAVSRVVKNPFQSLGAV